MDHQSSEQQRFTVMPLLAAGLLLLPLLYLGSYLALVDPYVASSRPVQSYHAGNYNYRYGGTWTPRVFWPLEQIDRRLRPRTWRELPPIPSPVVDPSA